MGRTARAVSGVAGVVRDEVVREKVQFDAMRLIK